MQKLLITLPCFNEELVLEENFKIIYKYACDNFSDFDWRILIIDNASTDSTWSLAVKLRTIHPDRALTDQEFEKGRGVALRRAWGKFSDFDIYSYMDIDLATDIKDFRLLVEKINEGNYMVVGSRYLPQSNINRDVKREILSRIYNLLLKIIFRVNFKDAQCGFKSFNKNVVTSFIPETVDDGWFWDTELMILLMINGYRLLEIPVTWKEVRDELRKSKVSAWSEVVKQLKNLYLMKKRLILGNVYLKKA